MYKPYIRLTSCSNPTETFAFNINTTIIIPNTPIMYAWVRGAHFIYVC